MFLFGSQFSFWVLERLPEKSIYGWGHMTRFAEFVANIGQSNAGIAHVLHMPWGA